MVHIKRETLETALENLFREAAEHWHAHGNWKFHLVGKVNDGEIVDFNIASLPPNSMIKETDTAIVLYQVKAFDPLYHENYDEWFEGENSQYDSWEDMQSADPDAFEELEESWRKIWMDCRLPELVAEAIQRIKIIGEVNIVD